MKKQGGLWNKMFGTKDEIKPGSLISEKLRSNSDEDNTVDPNDSIANIKKEEINVSASADLTSNFSLIDANYVPGSSKIPQIYEKKDLI